MIARERALDIETIEIWFQDEARIGQKNFGAVCPMEGKGAALIMPACNTEAMNLHLAEIAKIVAPRAHAVLLVDQAAWHMSTHLTVPPNMTIIALPPEIPRAQPGRKRLAVHAR